MASFAGSASVDQRRRRRLATENEQPERNAPDSAAASLLDPKDYGFKERTSTPQTDTETLPLRKVISPKWWKLSALSLVVLVVCAFTLTMQLLVESLNPALPWKLIELCERFSFGLYKFATVSLLAIAGQLSLLIWWARSRSLHDFAGRYRTWLWVAAAWFVTAFCLATDAHRLFGEVLALFWYAPVSEQPLMGWLLPASVLGLTIWSSLHVDMQRCRLSLSLLWLTFYCWSLAEAGVLTDHPFATTEVIRGLFLCGEWFLFTSLLFHARFVIYESPEPPEPRQRKSKKNTKPLPAPAPEDDAVAEKKPAKKAVTKTTPKKTTAKKSTTRKTSTTRKKTNKTVTTEKSVDEDSVKTETKTSARKSTPKKTTAKKKTPTKTSTAKKSTAKKTSSAKKTTAKKSTTPKKATSQPTPVATDEQQEPAESKPAQKTFRVDGPDPELLKGMSKRERRKARQQWRQEQQANAE